MYVEPCKDSEFSGIVSVKGIKLFGLIITTQKNLKRMDIRNVVLVARNFQILSDKEEKNDEKIC